jgi:hypothetical protein
MKRTRMLTLLLVVVGGTAGVSCGDATGPADPSGSYALAAVNGTGAPFVLIDHTFSSGDRLVLEVVYDSLVFTSDSTVQRTRAEQTTRFGADGTVLGPHRREDALPGRYLRAGGRVIIDWRGPLHPTVPTDTLIVEPGALAQTRLVGIWCAEGCPPPEPTTFTYRRR